jgi:3-hydroxybutyryl-CoA dehydratase
MKWNKGQEVRKTILITEDIVKDYANVSRDHNPVHLNQEYAEKSIFGKRIVHGMLLAGYISSILGNDMPGNGTIYLSQKLSFRAPVYIDDEVELIVTIKEITDKNWLILETNCYSNNKVVLLGEATVIPPQ